MNKEAGHSFSIKIIMELKIIGEAGGFLWCVSPSTEAGSVSAARSLTSTRSQPLLPPVVSN